MIINAQRTVDPIFKGLMLLENDKLNSLALMIKYLLKHHSFHIKHVSYCFYYSHTYSTFYVTGSQTLVILRNFSLRLFQSIHKVTRRKNVKGEMKSLKEINDERNNFSLHGNVLP